MVYMSCGNHTAEARNPEYGKVTVAIMAQPEARPGENMTAFRLASKMVVQEWYAAFFEMLALWEPGFVVQLPGQDSLSILQPRLGVIPSDLLEARSIAAVSSAWAVRCCTKLGPPNPGAGAPQQGDDSDNDGEGKRADDSEDDIPQAGLVVRRRQGQAQADVDSDSDEDALEVDVEAIVAANPPNHVRTAQLLLFCCRGSKLERIITEIC